MSAGASSSAQSPSLPSPPPCVLRWEGEYQEIQPQSAWTEDIETIAQKLDPYLKLVLHRHFSFTTTEPISVRRLGQSSFNCTFFVEIGQEPVDENEQGLSSDEEESKHGNDEDNDDEDNDDEGEDNNDEDSVDEYDEDVYDSDYSDEEPIELTLGSSKDEVPGAKVSLPRRFVMRVSLPILPGAKTESEVATMRFVKHRTCIPVPRVYMYNASSATNGLGYEWTLIELMPGRPYDILMERGEFTDNAIQRIGERIAEWMDSLSRIQFDKIGSLYMPSTPAPDGTVVVSDADWDHPPDPVVGQLVHPDYTGDWRLEYEFPKGPFDNMQDYLLSRAEVYNLEFHDPRQIKRAEVHRYEESDDEAAKARLEELLNEPVPQDWLRDQEAADGQDSNVTLRQYMAASNVKGSRYRHEDLAKKQATIKELIETIRSRISKTAKLSTFIQHWDLHSGNILIDRYSGEPTALIDWECMIAFPLGFGMDDVPKIFNGSQRLREWAREDGYGIDEEDMSQRVKVEKLMLEAFIKRLGELGSSWLIAESEEWKKKVTKGDRRAARILYRLEEAIGGKA